MGEGRLQPPGAGSSGPTRPSPRVPAPGTRGTSCGRGARRARRSSRTLPRAGRPHGRGASPGGGGCCGDCGCGAWAWGCWGCWGCRGRRLIPCPILECYSVTYNRVTRAAADVPNASIGHRNKEGRVPGSGLYNRELRDALIGSGGSRAGGERSRGSWAATRNPIAVLSWAPRGAGAFFHGT